jgi:hypothetical protein
MRKLAERRKKKQQGYCEIIATITLVTFGAGFHAVRQTKTVLEPQQCIFKLSPLNFWR